MSGLVLMIGSGVITFILTALLGYTVRISRQLAKVVQYFDPTSPVSESFGTLPKRVLALEKWQRRRDPLGQMASWSELDGGETA